MRAVQALMAPIAKAIVNGFDNPPDFFPWWAEPLACERFVEDKMAEPALA